MAVYNYSHIEELCLNCTRVQNFGFYKMVSMLSAPAEYFCQVNPYLNQSIGVLGDQACTPVDCLGIE